MKSFTKTEFDAATIHDLVRAQFGTAVTPQAIIPLKHGWFNTAYALELGSALPDVVLRIAPHPQQPILTYERDLMQREIAVMQLVQAQADVPIAPLLAYDFSRQVIDQDYMFVARLAGRPLDQTKSDMPSAELAGIYQELGHYVARLHTLTGSHFGYDCAALSASTWRGAFERMTTALLDDGEALAVTLPVDGTAVRTTLAHLLPLLDEVKTPRLVHWDLWEGNIFVHETNGRWAITGLIDWERALWGDPDIDQVMFRPADDPFWQGYGRSPRTDPDSQTRHTLYRLYLWLIMLIEDKVRFGGADHIPWVIEQFNRDWTQLQGTQI